MASMSWTSAPAAPVDDGTFGATQIVNGGYTVGRVDEIGGAEYLLVGSTISGIVGGGSPPFTLLVYSLASPLSPALVSSTSFQYGFMDDMVVEGNTVLVSVADYQLLFGFEFNSQTGNVLSINVSNPAAPTLATVLFGSSDPNANTTQLGVTLVNSQIAYVASSTNTGSSTQDGEGRVLVVNYSNPADLTYTQLLIPGTYQVVDIGIQGSEALVVGRTGGTDAYGVNGTMTLSLLDITNPLSPVLLGTMLVTQGQFPSGTGSSLNKISALPLGNGIFAVSESTVSGNPELMLVDPSNPNNILVTYTPVPARVNEMAVSGDLLYASSTQGLTIYNIGTFQGIPLSVSVEVPTSDVSIVAGSYSTPPTSVTTGTSYDTLTWNETYTFGDPTFPITWQSTVSNLAAGQVVPVTLGRDRQFYLRGHARHVPDARNVDRGGVDHRPPALLADRAARRDRDLRRATHQPDQQLGDLLFRRERRVRYDQFHFRWARFDRGRYLASVVRFESSGGRQALHRIGPIRQRGRQGLGAGDVGPGGNADHPAQRERLWRGGRAHFHVGYGGAADIRLVCTCR